ncbi:MAG: peptidylprolyl isomerase [Nitrospirae bacterium]|nr:peptidylprolyl isomerase [Nitrospirota bacterium]
MPFRIVAITASLWLASWGLVGCNSGVPAPEKGQVLAEVNKKQITVEEFNKEIEKIPPFIRPMFTQSDKGKREFLDDLITREVVFQEAGRQGLDKDPEYLKRLEEFQRNALLEVLLKKEVEDKASVTEEEVKQYYAAHKEEYRDDKVRASHILVKTEEEARAVEQELKKGRSFAELAKKHSTDAASKKSGGDLGEFSRGQMIPEFERAAFTLKKGEMSGIVRSEYGYHLIKVTDRKEGKLQEITQVSGQIRQKLVRDRQRQVFEAWIAGLKKAATIHVNDELLKSAGGGAAGEAPAAKPKGE